MSSKLIIIYFSRFFSSSFPFKTSTSFLPSGVNIGFPQPYQPAAGVFQVNGPVLINTAGGYTGFWDDRFTGLLNGSVSSDIR
jgi:hypothetical protein